MHFEQILQLNCSHSLYPLFMTNSDVRILTLLLVCSIYSMPVSKSVIRNRIDISHAGHLKQETTRLPRVK